LFGHTLEAHSFRTLEGELRLAVTLPDGSRGTVPVAATDVLGDDDQVETPAATVLSVDGLRRLRALIEAKSRGREDRGTRRRNA
jgi:hypothetical protein